MKAIKHIDIEGAKDALLERMRDERDHIYVRLEAASALLKINNPEAAEFIMGMIHDEYLANRLETVIILGEINNRQSIDILIQVLFDCSQNPEIRAGAAWALGELRNPEAIDALVRAFDEVDDAIKIESARALAKMASENTQKLLEEFKSNPGNRRPGIAWALMNTGSFNIKDLLHCLVDDDARLWVSYIVGFGDENHYIDQIEELKDKDPQVYFAVTVLWRILSSWVYGLKEY